jgi:hypothetical protein
MYIADKFLSQMINYDQKGMFTFGRRNLTTFDIENENVLFSFFEVDVFHLTSLHFVLGYKAVFYWPTMLRLHTLFVGVKAHATSPGCLEIYHNLFCSML